MPSANQVRDTSSEAHPLKSVEDMSPPPTTGNGTGTSMDSSVTSLNPAVARRKSKFSTEDDDDDDNVKDLLVYYAKNSTMHGIPTIVGSELYRGRHIFWIIVVCVMAIFLGTVIYWQMSDYYDYPTVTSVDVHYVSEEDFPAITICDPNYINALALKYFVKDNFTLYHLTRLTEFAGFYHRFIGTWKDRLDAPAPNEDSDKDWIGEVIDKLIDLLNNKKRNRLYCSWGEYHFKEHCPGVRGRLTEMGPCSTIDTRKIVKQVNKERTKKGEPIISKAMRGLTVYFDTVDLEIPYRIFQSDGFKIVLHDPDTQPLPLLNGFLVAGNTTVEVDITKNVKIGLPPPFEAFGSGTCVDTQDESFQNPLRRFPKYTKDVCEAECFIDYAVKECGGCRHFFHPGNESTCPIKHLAECFRTAEEKYYGGYRANATSESDASDDNSTCDCLMPCRQEFYGARVSSAPFKSTKYLSQILTETKRSLTGSVSYIHFYYSDPVVTTMKQVAIYSTEGLLGNIGGQIGLFMGFSLVTVAEMLELIFLLVTRGRSVKDRVKQQKQVEAAVRASFKNHA